MTDDLLNMLSDLKGRWMIGGSALDKVPPAWRAAVEHDPNPEVALLALAGQAIQFALQPVPGGELQPMPELPRLRLAPPPLEAREQIRHLVRVAKFTQAQMEMVIHLLAMRGYSIHPVDHMPTAFARLPDLYAPWANWKQAEVTGVEASEDDMINAGNWDDWLPAARRIALARLRRENPVAARELLAEKLHALPAEQRLRIVELLAEGLGREDQTLLEGFSKDRSGKVKQLVRRFLGRIGAVEDDAEELAEYANYFSVVRKRLRGGYKITANKLKTSAQRKRRSELAVKLSLQSFAQGLQLADVADLVHGWEYVDIQASDEFVSMVATTGSDQAAASLASRITSLNGISAEAFQQLFDRLGKASRRELLPQVLKNDDASLSGAVVCAQGLWGEVPLEQLSPLRALKELKKLIKEEGTSTSEEKVRNGLFSLGLLADQSAAVALLEMFTENNASASDPMLGILKLNACLPPGDHS